MCNAHDISCRLRVQISDDAKARKDCAFGRSFRRRRAARERDGETETTNSADVTAKKKREKHFRFSGEQWKPRRLQLQRTPARDRATAKAKNQESEGRRRSSLYMARLSTTTTIQYLCYYCHAGVGVDRASIVSPFRPAGKQEQERPTSGACMRSSCRATTRHVARRASQLCSGLGPVGTSRLATP